jgi:hypothetical protein
VDSIATFEDLDALLKRTNEQAQFGGNAEVVL